MLKTKTTTGNRVILFMDIHNYSLAAKGLGKQSSSFIQQVYETLGSIIVSQQGEIIKYMGDAILALFPAGSETEVVRCSLELRSPFPNSPAVGACPVRLNSRSASAPERSRWELLGTNPCGKRTYSVKRSIARP